MVATKEKINEAHYWIRRAHTTNRLYYAGNTRQRGYDTNQFGWLAGGKENWPIMAQKLAEDIVLGNSDEGILLCWTGTGVSLAANKVPGIRASLCADAETTRGVRLWNNANILCLSIRNTSEVVAREILDMWFDTKYKPNTEDDLCLEQVKNIEKKYLNRIPN